LTWTIILTRKLYLAVKCSQIPT